jgi:glucans biosynthesis protein C
VFLTLLVITHHAAQPYGSTGGRWLIFNAEQVDLGAFFATNAAFFMGLFFAQRL